MGGGLQAWLHENKATEEEEEMLLHGVKILNNKLQELLDLQLSEIISLYSVFSPERPFPTPTQTQPSSLPPSGQTCEPDSAVAATGRRSWRLPHGAGQTSDPPVASGPSLSSRERELREEEQLLLAKIHQLTGDASRRPRSMKRLVPGPFEILSDDTQLVSSAPPPGDVWETPLTSAPEPAANHTGRLTVVEAEV